MYYIFSMSKAIHYESLGDKTYNEIKRMILSGELKSGERLRYKDMVDRLEVSQTPIKEAFTRLEKEGFVFTIPHRGTMVNEVSPKDILEMFQIREALETLAVKLAVINIKKTDIERLKGINNRFENFIESQDVRRATEEDYNFHEMLYKLSANNRLHNLINYSNIHLLSIAEMSNDFFGNARIYYKNHQEIIEAIEKNKSEEAQTLMRKHIQFALQQVLNSKE